ncbi:MAG: hypothetical protein ACE5LH_02210 [Fidelibacterota bacterium]
MSYKPERILLSLTVTLLSTISPSSAQVTEIIRKTDILNDPEHPGEVAGRLYPGTEIRKTGKDSSGHYVKAILEFYVPVDALKEGRIAKGIGESQRADDAVIKLLTARRSGEKVTVSVEITNLDDRPLDMSALLLLKLVDGTGLLGNLEFMESTHSVATIPPGETVASRLVYSFPDEPRDVELIFQSRLRGDRVYFDLGF